MPVTVWAGVTTGGLLRHFYIEGVMRMCEETAEPMTDQKAFDRIRRVAHYITKGRHIGDRRVWAWTLIEAVEHLEKSLKSRLPATFQETGSPDHETTRG